MLTITNPIVLRITKLRVTSARGLDDLDDGAAAQIVVEASNTGGPVETHLVTVRDGTSSGLTEANNRVTERRDDTPTGLADLRAAVAAATGRPAKFQAIETWLLVADLLPPGSIT